MINILSNGLVIYRSTCFETGGQILAIYRGHIALFKNNMYETFAINK